MASPSRFGWPSLIAIFFLFLSLLNIATSLPLPDDNIDKNLVARTEIPISQARYEAYLKKYFPATNTYLFYSGGAKTQVKNFIAKNPKYLYYDDIFNVPESDYTTKKHPWWKAFDQDKDMDDGEASSMALAEVVTGDVLVFGAIEYMTVGAASFFTTKEIDTLEEGMRSGRIKSINHMAKDATKPSQIMAKADANGKFTWQPGYKEGMKNASGPYGVCKRALGGGCDAPKIKPKPKRKCKRTGTSNGACAMPTPSATKPKASPTPTPKSPPKSAKPAKPVKPAKPAHLKSTPKKKTS